MNADNINGGLFVGYGTNSALSGDGNLNFDTRLQANAGLNCKFNTFLKEGREKYWQSAWQLHWRHASRSNVYESWARSDPMSWNPHRKAKKLWASISSEEKPRRHTVLRVVIFKTLVGRRTGPLTRSCLSLARLIKSVETSTYQSTHSVQETNRKITNTFPDSWHCRLWE